MRAVGFCSCEGRSEQVTKYFVQGQKASSTPAVLSRASTWVRPFNPWSLATDPDGQASHATRSLEPHEA